MICEQTRCEMQKQQNGVICSLWASCPFKIIKANESTTEPKRVKPKKKKPTDTNYVPLEEEEQRTLYEWCEWHNIKMVHIPNERESASMRRKLATEGVQNGFPDTFFPYARHGYYGLFIELKRRDKRLSKVSQEQIEWGKLLKANGYAFFVCYGADSAVNIIKKYMELKE